MNCIVGVKNLTRDLKTLKLIEIENHRGLKNFRKVLGVLEPPVSSRGSKLLVSSGGSRTVGK